MIRRILFQVHMWVGLVLGVFFVALGLSAACSSITTRWTPRRRGPPRPVRRNRSMPSVAAAREAAPDARGNVFLTLPEEPGDPVLVRFLPAQRDGAGRGAGRPAAAKRQPSSSIRSRPRRSARAPLRCRRWCSSPTTCMAASSSAATAGRWSAGSASAWDPGPQPAWCCGGPSRICGNTPSLVRRTAKGLRFPPRAARCRRHLGLHRLHPGQLTPASASPFRETLRAATGGGAAPAFSLRTGPEVEPMHGAPRIGADEAVRVALAAVPGSAPRSVMLPGRKTQAISVSARRDGAEDADPDDGLCRSLSRHGDRGARSRIVVLRRQLGRLAAPRA
ncbi:MAG: hypothetical protein WDM81_03200 [Rhizomicrobium sp.]